MDTLKIIDDKGSEYNYNNLEVIGRGKFGVVYKAHENNKVFAIKIIKNPTLENEERKILVNLSEKQDLEKKEYMKHLIEMYYSLRDQSNYYYFVMKLYPAGDLKKLIIEKINKKQEFETALVWRWISDLVKGIDFLHSNCIIHRDIKPENILMEEIDGQLEIKIADFGISAILGANSVRFTDSGTNPYKSPEMKEGRAYSYEPDIWSAGCVLFELITLKVYDKSEDSKEYNLPEQIYFDFLKKMLVKNPDKRAKSKELVQVVERNLNTNDSVTVSFKALRLEVNYDTTNLETEDLIYYERLSGIKSDKKIIIISSTKPTGKTTFAKRFATEFCKESNHFSYFMKASSIDVELENLAVKFQIRNANSSKLDFLLLSKIFLSEDPDAQILFIIDDLLDLTNVNLCNIFQNIPNKVRFLIATNNSTIHSQFNETDSHHIEFKPFNVEDCLGLFKLSLSSKLSSDSEDQEDELTKLTELIEKEPMENRLEATLNIVSHFRDNVLDSFDEIISKFFCF